MSYKERFIKMLSGGNANKPKTNKERFIELLSGNDATHQTATANTLSADDA